MVPRNLRTAAALCAVAVLYSATTSHAFVAPFRAATEGRIAVITFAGKTSKKSEFKVVFDDNGKEAENRRKNIIRERSKPPEFTVVPDEKETVAFEVMKQKRLERAPKPPEFTVVGDDDGDGGSARSPAAKSASTATRPRNNPTKRIRRPPRIKRDIPNMEGTNWMQKNVEFSDQKKARPTIHGATTIEFERPAEDPKSFRQDFRGTRVFVMGLPQHVGWQELKDHFKEAGNVVYASVSLNKITGESKGHGIVQYETTAEAMNAIQIMGDYPLDGSTLFVRKDVQEQEDPNVTLGATSAANRYERRAGGAPPSIWKCANEDSLDLPEDELKTVKALIEERDDARKRRDYDVSDRLRDDLKMMHGVFLDDRLKMWWTSLDGKQVPQTIQNIKGDGRWNLKPWRQIPTTPENDDRIDSELVERLLKRRDMARREKDFQTADRLLEEARTSPDGDFELRIHDESRTWRAWTEHRPPVGPSYGERREAMPSDPIEARKAAGKQCIALVEEFAPQKLEEIKQVLQRFPGREFQVLKRLKQQYL